MAVVGIRDAADRGTWTIVKSENNDRCDQKDPMTSQDRRSRVSQSVDHESFWFLGHVLFLTIPSSLIPPSTIPKEDNSADLLKEACLVLKNRRGG